MKSIEQRRQALISQIRYLQGYLGNLKRLEYGQSSVYLGTGSSSLHLIKSADFRYQ